MTPPSVGLAQRGAVGAFGEGATAASRGPARQHDGYCKCPRCRVPADAARAHVEELRRLGWYDGRICKAAGISHQKLHGLSKYATTHRRTHQAVLALPLVPDVDPVAIERVLSGEPVRLTRAERRVVAARLVSERGWNEAMRLLRVSGSTLRQLVEAS